MPDRHRVLVAAERYLKHGWKLLPLVGKEPAVINEIRLGVKHATSKLERIRSWIRAVPNMNIGGTPPANTAIIDVDYYKDSPNLLPVAKELSGLGGPVQFTPSGGAHFLFQHPVPPARELCQYYGVAKGIDVKAHAKGYVVLAPSTFEGKQYRWKHGRGIDLLVPALSEDIINGYDHHLVKDKDSIEFKDFTTWAQERQKVRAALKVIEPDINYNEWLTTGQALHSIDPDPEGPAFKVWDTWSSVGGKYKTGEPARKWKTFKQGGGVTIATLYDMATRENLHWRDKIKTKQRTDDDESERIRATPLSEFKETKIEWLVREVCAAGELTLIAGDGGSGKSTFAAALAHLLVMGGWSPAAGFGHGGKEIPPQGDVILLAQEENVGSILKPRFLAQGTDTAHILMLGSSTRDEDVNDLVRLDEDLEKVEYEIKQHKHKVCALLVDPLTGYLGETDQNSEPQLRETLSRLVNMARRMKIAVVGLMHPNKKVDLRMVDRIMGGSAFKNVARHVLVMTPDPNNNAAFRFAVVSKTNIGTEGLSFVLHGHQKPSDLDAEQEIKWATIEHDVELGHDVDQIMRQHRRQVDEHGEARGNMTQWVLAAVNESGARGIDTVTLRGIVAQQWQAANEGRELNTSFDQQINNVSRNLCRDGRTVRLLPIGGARRGTVQRYFAARYADTMNLLWVED